MISAGRRPVKKCSLIFSTSRSKRSDTTVRHTPQHVTNIFRVTTLTIRYFIGVPPIKVGQHLHECMKRPGATSRRDLIYVV